jgi:hypothetical protein
MSTKPNRRPNPGANRPGGKVSAAAKSALRGEAVSHEPLLAFGRMNWILMGAGAGAAVLGFLLLSRGDITLAPILLVAGYCALLPLGIVWSERRPPAGGPTPRGE